MAVKSKTKATKENAKTSKKQKKKIVKKGRIYITTTYNNTLITFTDELGAPMAWSSSGVVGFKGGRKSTPYAGQKTAENLNMKISKLGVQEVDVYLKGPGTAKQLALKELANGGYRILNLIDNTPYRFGGVKSKKKPRK